MVPGFTTLRPVPADPEPYPDSDADGDVPAELDQLAEPPLVPVAPADPATHSETFEPIIAALVADDRMTGDVAFEIRNAESDEVLYSYQGDVAQIPASNMKVITAAAALRELGPDRQFETTVVVDSGVVYLIGGGDILIAKGEGNPDAVLGHAGMTDLAVQTAAFLAEQGVAEIEVKVDASLFTGTDYHPDVTGGDTQFLMPVRPIATDIGRGENGAFLPSPELYAGVDFANALEAQGIVVNGDIYPGVAPAPTQENTAGVVKSAPVRELVKWMLVESDNSLAETLGHMIAVETGREASFDGAATATLQSLADEGFDTANIRVADNSGMSMSNRITPTLLNDILIRAYSCDACELASIPSGMPVSGLDGTLTTRFDGSEVRGLVRAKTGTLVQVNSLSGYLTTTSGEILAFALVIDDIEPGTVRIARPAIDETIEALATGRIPGAGEGES